MNYPNFQNLPAMGAAPQAQPMPQAMPMPQAGTMTPQMQQMIMQQRMQGMPQQRPPMPQGPGMPQGMPRPMMGGAPMMRPMAPQRTMAMARGGLAQAAESSRRAGRRGDSMLVHMHPKEFQLMRHMGAQPTRNPKTGLPELFSWGDLAAAALPLVADSVAPSVGSSIGSGITSLFGGASDQTNASLGSALLGAGIGGIANGWNGALTGASTGALGAGAGSQLGSLVSNNPATAKLIGNALLGAGAGQGTGVGAGAGAGLAALLTAAAPALSKSTSGTPLGNLFGNTGSDASSGSGSGGLSYFTPSMSTNADGSPITAAQVGAVDPSSSVTAAAASGASKGIPTNNVAAWTTILKLLGATHQPKPASPSSLPKLPTSYTTHLNPPAYTRTPNAYTGNYYTYGESPEFNFYSNNQVPQNAPGQARGGLQQGMGNRAPQAPMYVKGPGDGTSDNINAKLSDGEYVVPAHVVAALGNGSSDAGAKALDQLQANVRRRVGKQMASNKQPTRIGSPEKYLGRGAK